MIIGCKHKAAINIGVEWHYKKNSMINSFEFRSIVENLEQIRSKISFSIVRFFLKTVVENYEISKIHNINKNLIRFYSN